MLMYRLWTESVINAQAGWVEYISDGWFEYFYIVFIYNCFEYIYYLNYEVCIYMQYSSLCIDNYTVVI